MAPGDVRLAHLVVASRGEYLKKRECWPRAPRTRVSDAPPLRFRSPQCHRPSYLPLRCMAGGCGRLLRGPRAAPGLCSGSPAPSACSAPVAGVPGGAQDGGGRCLEVDSVAPVTVRQTALGMG